MFPRFVTLAMPSCLNEPGRTGVGDFKSILSAEPGWLFRAVT
jgi:hypothetical protein